jgi:hypothetical protein
MRFREFNPLRESFYSKKGKASFKKSDVNDSHILKVIEKISLETGVPKEEIIKEMQEDIEKIKEIGHYSPMLYGTILQNALGNNPLSRCLIAACTSSFSEDTPLSLYLSVIDMV